MPGLKVWLKERGEKRIYKKNSTELNLGPLTLRGTGHYAYCSEGVMDCYSKMAWAEPCIGIQMMGIQQL